MNIRKWIKSNIKSILLYILIVFLFFTVYKRNKQIKIDSYNIKSLTEEITYNKDEYDREVASKSILMLDIASLKEINSNLYKEIELGEKRNLSEINSLKLNINLLQDSISELQANLIKVDSNLYVYNVVDTNQYYRYISNINVLSQCKPDNVYQQILEHSINADIIIKKYFKQNQIKLDVYSNNPFVKFNQIEGSIINIPSIPSRKRFSLGVGLFVGPTYGFINKQFDVSVGLGFTLNYNLINF